MLASIGQTYRNLLASLGIVISEEDWDAVHPPGPSTPKSPLGPDRPHHYDKDSNLPVFTSSQLEWCEPELYGFTQYEVVEDEATAHPFTCEYEDELNIKMNHRPIHRYDRVYRIRWALEHIIGCVGTCPKEVETRLRACMDADVIYSRNAYEWVRKHLKEWKLSHLYLSIPGIVSRLGGPRWKVTADQCRTVLGEATMLHRLFDQFKRAGTIKRQRFPKIQYVLLRLLDRHGIMPPYRVPWARTSIKRRQLNALLTVIETTPSCQTNAAPAQTCPNNPPNVSESPNASTPPVWQSSSNATSPSENPCPDSG